MWIGFLYCAQYIIVMRGEMQFTISGSDSYHSKLVVDLSILSHLSITNGGQSDNMYLLMWFNMKCTSPMWIITLYVKIFDFNASSSKFNSSLLDIQLSLSICGGLVPRSSGKYASGKGSDILWLMHKGEIKDTKGLPVLMF